MANEKVYVIKITNETGGRKVAEKAGGAGGIQNKTNNENKGGETSEKATAQKALSAVFAYKNIKSVVTTVADYRVSTVQLRTGSSLAQQKASYWYNTAQKGLSFVESVATGAAVGGIPGAIIGAALSAVAGVVNIVQKEMRLSTQEELEQNSRDIKAQRTTVSGSRFQNATQM